MTKIAIFHIENVFEITGRGLVFAGRIVDGIISTGNEIEFNFNNTLRRRKITSVEEIRHSNPKKINIGLLIECNNQDEINELKGTKKILSTTNIYNNKLKLSELIDWLSNKSIKNKILFNELLLSDLTTMNRGIWSDESTNNESKIESLKWSNELSHRIWNLIFELRRNEDDKSEEQLGENINIYAKKSKELAGHLVASISSTVNRFYYFIEK